MPTDNSLAPFGRTFTPARPGQKIARIGDIDGGLDHAEITSLIDASGGLNEAQVNALILAAASARIHARPDRALARNCRD